MVQETIKNDNTKAYGIENQDYNEESGAETQDGGVNEGNFE